MALFDLSGDDKDAPASSASLRQAVGVGPGDILDGRYRIERVVGEGGMGQVLAATHLGLGQEVAIKIMLAEKATDTDSVERFLREARAVVMLKSSHIARVFDVAKTPAGLPYIVMELLDGKDLVTVLLESGALPYGDAVDVILQACDALAEAHGLGIIHRDLKPENFFLSRRRDGTPHVKLIDFGISKLGIEANTKSGRRVVTQENTVLGSPTYMSPEQVRNSKSVDERSDIWSVGVSLYELLTAAEPFGADSIPEIFVNVLTITPPSPDQLVADIPHELAAIVMRCIEKDPAARFQSVGELASALGRFGSGKVSSVAPTWGDDSAPDSQSSLVARLAPATSPQFKVPGLPPGAAGAASPLVAPVASSPAPMSVSATISETRKSGRGRSVALVLAAIVLLSTVGAGALWKVRRDRSIAAAAMATPPPNAAAASAIAAGSPPEASAEPPPSASSDSTTSAASPATSASTRAAASAAARGGRPPAASPKPATAPRSGAAPKSSALPRERTSW